MDPGADYGSSDFDQRHNLVLHLIAETPRRSGLAGLLSRWQFATVAGFRSGFPFSIISDFLNIEPGSGILQRNRADFSGSNPGQAFLAQPGQTQGGLLLLDPSRFSAPSFGHFGSSTRNAFHGPGFWNVDFSVSRRFSVARLGEQGSLQLRLEIFNLFNHTNLGNPETLLQCQDRNPLTGAIESCFGRARFGRQGVGSSLPSSSPLNEVPRRIQLGAKLYF